MRAHHAGAPGALQRRMRKALVAGWMLALVLGVGLADPAIAQTPSPSPAPSPTPSPAPSPTPPPAPTCTNTVGPSIAPPPASSLVTGLPGYRAQFHGQSGYPTLCPGATSVATVAFHNSGSLGWYAGSAPAMLGTSGPEPGQDQPSILGGLATGWPAPNRVAAQPAPYVGPGQVAWFQFTVKAPTTPGIYRLALRPVVEGHQWLDDFGVFWYVTVKQDDRTVPQLPPPPQPALTYHPTVSGGIRSIYVPTLMYHYVDWLPEQPDRFRVDLTVSPPDFEAHLAHLKAEGYTSVTAGQVWWTLDQGGPLPAKPVNLTFDDGTIGQYEHAFKLLRKHGMVGTFYVTANLVDRPGYITRAMLREMARAGMEIQSHGVDHVALPASDQVYQLCVSRRILSEWSGADVLHLTYPSGAYDGATFAALQRCGYLTAYWTSGGSLQSSDRMYLLYRARVRGQQGLAALLSALSR